jgi:hypothetical protein
MPIQYGTYTKQLKLLPLTLSDDGTAVCTARFGFVGDDGEFQSVEGRSFTFSAEEVSGILDAEPTSGLTRRDDLSLAIYTYLVSQGHVLPGSIS